MIDTRRRTRCIYCGRRIPGALTRQERNKWETRQIPELTVSARYTCADHRYLPFFDPDLPDKWADAR